MKILMDDKLKHRLVGAAVILSLGAIFLPAMMKQSSQHFENNFSVHVKLPPKPATPHVAIANEDELFKTIKVAQVELPNGGKVRQISHEVEQTQKVESTASTSNQSQEIAQVATASANKPLELALNETAPIDLGKAQKTRHVTPVSPVKPVAPVKPVRPVKVIDQPSMPRAKVIKAIEPTKTVLAKVPQVVKATTKAAYAVQLASFSKIGNAQALVEKLQHKGYKANYVRVVGKKGVIYKVYAGHSSNKDQAIKLKSQLASAMQLNGFVVSTGVS
ncbi:MAG: SPOR domain-containing protein [Legionella sp.]|nr:SPOR domain-containing protein [Legionella sp.]